MGHKQVVSRYSWMPSKSILSLVMAAVVNVSSVYSDLEGLANGKANYFLILLGQFILWTLAVLYSVLQI
jgi:hypothetical protein